MIDKLKQGKRVLFFVAFITFLFLGGVFTLNFFIIQKLIDKFNYLELTSQKKLLNTYLKNIKQKLLTSNYILKNNFIPPKNLNISYALINLKTWKYIKKHFKFPILSYEDIISLKDKKNICFFKKHKKKVYYICSTSNKKIFIYSAKNLNPKEAKEKYDLYINFLDSIGYLEKKEVRNLLYFQPLKDYNQEIVSFLFVYISPNILNLTKTIFNFGVTYASLILAFFVVFLIPFYFLIKKQIKQRFIILTDILKGLLSSNNQLEKLKFAEEILNFPSEEKEFLRKLEDLTLFISQKMFRDPLTGAFNRLYFSSRLKEEINRAKRYNHPLSLILLDIDFFKKINDTYGHDVGDLVLKTISQIILENIRKTDLFARIGGEEFAILLPDTPKDKAILVAEKLREIVGSTPIVLPNGKQIQVTISLGVTQLVKNDNEKTFLKRADEALYDAKNSGRNVVKCK